MAIIKVVKKSGKTYTSLKMFWDMWEKKHMKLME